METPYPNFARPLAYECIKATEALIKLHGKPVRTTDPLKDHLKLAEGHHQVYVLDSLVRTILSQNTTDKTSIRAFTKLKEHFPSWKEVLEAPNGEVEDAIREGGLAQIKVERIKSLLAHLEQEHGECSMEWLREKSTEYIKEYLGQFKGVGPKTISCTLMFAMGRDDFPVDTHVHRISKSLGWIPKQAGREDAYQHLNMRVPDEVKYDLHVLLVKHGKVCGQCSSRPRGSEPCPLKLLKATWKSQGGRTNALVESTVKEECLVKDEEMKPDISSLPVKTEQDTSSSATRFVSQKVTKKEQQYDSDLGPRKRSKHSKI